MAEVNGPAPQPTPGAPAPAVAGQPATFQVPDGYRMVKSDEYDGLSRMAEKGRGADSFYAKAKSAGFEKADDFDRWSPALKAIKDRKLEPDFISKAFGMTIPDESGSRDKAEAPQFDPEKFKTDFRGELKREQAVEHWTEAVKSEPALIAKTVESLAADAPFKGSMLKRAVQQAFDEVRGAFPEGHPLAKTHPEYLTDKHAAKVVESLKKEWADEKAANDASDVTNKADRLKAAAKKPSTVAGPGTGQGKPAAPKPGEWKPPSDNDIEEAHQRLVAARTGRR
jgi:hypothetical protein